MVNTMLSLPRITLKFHVKYHLLGTLSAKKCNAVLQGETYIASWVFHDCPHIYEDNQRSFLQHLQAPYGPYRVITTNNNYTIWCKISYFRCSLCKGNMRMWCREWHPLLLKCLINFLRYIRMVRRAPGRIYNPHIWSTLCHFCQK